MIRRQALTTALLALVVLAPQAAGSAPPADEATRRRRAAAASERGAIQVQAGHEADLLAAYEDLGERGRPLFVSCDLVFHGTRRILGAAISVVEEEALLPSLQELTAALLDAALFDSKSFKGEVRRAAAAWNAGYFAVARALLTGEPLDETRLAPLEKGAVLAAARNELAMIRAHDGVHMSPLFGASPLRSQYGPNGEDYTVYEPRGHYARSEALGRYFRGRLYLARPAFPLRDEGSPYASPDLRATRQALHIASIVTTRPAAAAAWRDFANLDRLLFGAPDDPGPGEYLTLWKTAADNVAKRGGVMTDAESESARFTELAALIRKSKRPAIREGYVDGMRLLGQSATWDAEALEVLTRGGVPPDGRVVPKGLDVMALIGSGAARERLEAEGDLAIAWYRAAFDSLTRPAISQVSDKSRALTGASVPLSTYWLRALARLYEPAPSGSPAFMSDPTWRWKDLVTGSAGWAEMRYETILSVKEPITEAKEDYITSGHSATAPYLEPRPAVYGDLAAVVRAIDIAFRAYPRPLGRATDATSALTKTLASLEEIASTELEGRAISREDRALLAGLASEFRRHENRLIGADSKADGAVIADVFADHSTGTPRYLEVGTGVPYAITVVVEPGTPAREGAIFSYHEFASEKRLTADAWRARLGSPDAPPLPAWEAEWLATFR